MLSIYKIISKKEFIYFTYIIWFSIFPIKGNRFIWVEQNNCNTTPERNISESGNIIIETYNDVINGTVVKLVTIVDGTHSWPGGKKGWAGGSEPTKEINATDMIWDFFKEHHKQ